jgi:hypothetical protein
MIFGSAFGSIFGSSHEEGKEFIVVRSDQELMIVYDQKSADIRDFGIMQNRRERRRRKRNDDRAVWNKSGGNEEPYKGASLSDKCQIDGSMFPCRS